MNLSENLFGPLRPFATVCRRFDPPGNGLLDPPWLRPLGLPWQELPADAVTDGSS